MACRQLHKRHGSVLVITAICLVVLLGIAALAVDIGQLRLARQRAQNVADACAIGSAHLLTGLLGSDTPATEKAQALALSNNTASPNWKVYKNNGEAGVTATVIPEGTKLTLADGTPVTVGLNQAIKVQCRVKVDYAFAPAMSALLGESGDTSGSAGATAVAMWKSVDTLSQNVMPWVMPRTQLWDASGNVADVGKEFVMKVNSPQDSFVSNGNFQCVRYAQDKGGDDYRDRIAGTRVDPVNISIGDVLNPENGNKVGPTDQGLMGQGNGNNIKGRLQYSKYQTTNASCVFEDWKNQGYQMDSRVVVIPVAQYPLPTDGEIKVIGFAAFFICNAADNGQVTGHFITAREDGGKLVFGGTNLSNTGSTSLISSIRLVK